MTLGEKIKEARQQAGLSQQQLAEKLGVSRSAVAKWESDYGICDVDNLKALSKLFDVSIDYLLSDETTFDKGVIKESYQLSAYGKGSKKKKKDRVVFEKFPDAKINTLLGKVKLTKSEKVIDNLLGFLTEAPFGIPDFINGMKNLDKEFYLVEKNEQQYFIVVSDEWIETRKLTNPIHSDRFELENWQFIKCGFQLKK